MAFERLDREEILARLEEEGSKSDLSGLDLSGVDLSRMDLRGVDLSRADLSAADLRWAVLEGADLHSSVLRRADVRWAIMRGANLRQADLGRANLGWADVAGADFTGAELDGANLESVEMGEVIMDRPAARGSGRSGNGWRGRLTPAAATAMPGTAAPIAIPGSRPVGWPDRLTVPKVSATSIALALLGVMALFHVWGWLFRRAYFLGGFELDVPGIVTFGQSDNLLAGVLEILPLTLKAMVTAPFALVAAALVMGLILAPVLLLWFFGERVLDDIVRPQVRPVVVSGLFVAYVVLFLLFIIPGLLDVVAWIRANGLPGDESLRTIGQLFDIGGIFVKLGLLAALGLSLVPLWTAWRAFSHWIVRYDLPTEWRLRYPALNAFAGQVRESNLFVHDAPLDDEERRRGWLGLIGLALLLATLFTGAGRVQAYNDMCDGGDLPRIQLFHGDAPAGAKPATFCQRMVFETRDAWYVFFPSQTQERIAGDFSSRVPNLREVEKPSDGSIEARPGTGDGSFCGSCGDGPDGSERFVHYPDEQRLEGVVDFASANLVMLDDQANESGFTAIKVNAATLITRDGAPAEAADAKEGDIAVAYGSVDLEDATVLLARELALLSEAPAGDAVPVSEPSGSLNVDSFNPQNPVIQGSDWTPGNKLEVLVVRDPADGSAITGDTQGNVLIPEGIEVGPDGSFSKPIIFDPRWPTGPELQVLVRDPQTGQFQTYPWLSEPPPTATLVPPTPVPQPTEEATFTPEPEDGEGAGDEETATPTPEDESPATNTPLPEPEVLPPGSVSPPFADCEPDEYEPDGWRGVQTTLYPALDGEPELQEHNFCPKGDIDLYGFQVKAGRHYRVFTTALAPGVDTVMAVGDLSPGTGCQPWHPEFGCWSDDRNDFSLASEVIFQAIANQTVIVTIDNRGTRSGEEATYQIGVEQYRPDEVAEGTGTITPTPTGTPGVRNRDAWDDLASNNNCTSASDTQTVGIPSKWGAIIGTSADEDWYLTNILPGAVTSRCVQVRMEPPEDRDYDLDVGIATGSGRSRDCKRIDTNPRDGDRAETVRIILPADMDASDNQRIFIRVYPRPGSRDFDEYNDYTVETSYFEDSQCEIPPTVTPEPTTSPSPTAIPTPIPTITPTPVLALPPTPTP